MSLYICNGCSEPIPAQKARLQCDNCVGDHFTCANCYVVGNYTRQHTAGHESSLIVQSGYQPNSHPQQVPSPQPAVPSAQNQTTKPAVLHGWQPLFSGSAPTATYTAFLTAIFKKIDTDNDGLITPEQYSSFLDVQQYTLEEDICKQSIFMYYQ
jgi:hypothetical protein